MNPLALMRVMYGPLGYAHPDHRTIADVDLARMPADVANQWLIDHHRLDTAIDFDWRGAPRAAPCVDHWARLPRIAYLIGVQRLRAALVERGRYVRLDASSQRLSVHAARGRAESRVRRHARRRRDRRGRHRVPHGRAARRAARAAPAPALLFPRAHAARLASGLDGAHDDARAAWSSSLFSFAVNHALLEPAPVS
ncbi:type III secretion apparatus protein OrgA/MxiK [Burkholderia pseudomallei]